MSELALVKSLQQAIDYIETHLLEPVTIEDIAGWAHLSPFHFQRTFTILTGISVGAYVRRRRLTLAGEELLQSGARILDVALKYGYETPEAFARAFRQQHGLTPSEARAGAGPLRSYSRLTIQVSLKGVEPMNYRIVEREAFEIVGVRREFDCDEEDRVTGINGFWGEAHQSGTIDRLVNLSNGTIKGLLGVTHGFDANRNTIQYWIAAEHAGDGAADLERMEIPAARWVVFEVRGPVPVAMVEAWRRIYGEWFPSHSYEPADAPPIEAYLDADVSRPDARNEIWVAVK